MKIKRHVSNLLQKTVFCGGFFFLSFFYTIFVGWIHIPFHKEFYSQTFLKSLSNFCFSKKKRKNLNYFQYLIKPMNFQ
uniref:Uncharacterized protein n=1 Tax=Octopus bimaculoides TaxID=37653 RepID=A0A0L8I0E0_OCTBM